MTRCDASHNLFLVEGDSMRLLNFSRALFPHVLYLSQVVWKPLEALILRTFRKTSDGLIRAQWKQHPLAPPPPEEALAHHHHHHHHRKLHLLRCSRSLNRHVCPL